MAKRYQVNSQVRRVNRMMSWLVSRGWSRSAVLSTVGRHSGETRRVPISPIEIDDIEYLVAPYGDVGWVLNARANPTAKLTRKKTTREVQLHEVGADAARVVHAYYQREKYARPYMDVPTDPSVDDFAAKSDKFPVFRVESS